MEKKPLDPIKYADKHLPSVVTLTYRKMEVGFTLNLFLSGTRGFCLAYNYNPSFSSEAFNTWFNEDISNDDKLVSYLSKKFNSAGTLYYAEKIHTLDDLREIVKDCRAHLRKHRIN